VKFGEFIFGGILQIQLQPQDGFQDQASSFAGATSFQLW
jgi:hypothetical protein